MGDTELFFVYGTLKEGGHFSSEFDGVRVKVTKARLEGFGLFSLGWFPTIQTKEGSVVHGELHEYTHPEAVLRAMDRIEGFTGNPDSDLFERKRVTVQTAEGPFEAYVYEFARDLPPNAKEITSGVWGV